MREPTKGQILAAAVAVAAVLAAVTAGATVAWVTDEVRVFGLAALPPAVVASLLVVSFDWRATRLRRMLAEPKHRRKVAKEE